MKFNNLISVFQKITIFVNKLPLPNRAWIILGLSLVWWVTDFQIEYERTVTYYNNLLMSGTLPPEADSISIPIMSYVFADLFFGLIFGCYLLWALWGIQSNNRAINFNTNKPIRSSISWLVTCLWLFIATSMFIVRLSDGSLNQVGLQIISFYCAIATNAVVQNKT
jgi:hypothetical protein